MKDMMRALYRSWPARRRHAGLPDDVGVLPDGRGPAVQHGPHAVYLPVPHLRQEHNLCVPTAAAMVLQAWGEPHDPRELKRLSRGQAAGDATPFDDFTITMFRDLLTGLQQLGHDWREVSFANNGTGFRQGLACLQAHLRRGLPALVDTSLYGGHTFVLAGFDARQQMLHAVDPNLAAPGRRSLHETDFATIWHSGATGFDGRAAILPQPRTRQAGRQPCDNPAP